jgi:hypothetical protein
MRVYFRPPRHGHERLLSEAEIHFGEGLLGGTRLLGFGVWRSAEGQLYVTFPSRATIGGAERRYVDYLRSVDGQAESVRRVKAWILAEYRKLGIASGAGLPVTVAECHKGSAQPGTDSRTLANRQAGG